jgi:putative DNA primase/helicase
MMDGATAILSLIDSAPAFTEPQAAPGALTGEDLRRAGLAALDQLLAHMRAQEGDTRGNVLQEVAEQAGCVIGAGALNEAFAKAALEDAAAGVGLIRDLGAKAVKGAIAAGIKVGKKAPREFCAEAAAAANSLQSQPRPGVVSNAPSGALEDDAGNSAAVRISSSLDLAIPGDEVGGADPSDQGKPESPSFSAAAAPRSPVLETEQDETLADEDDDGDDLPPGDDVSEETFRACAALDQSDVDNGKRLIAYFGRDLLVRQEDDVPAGQMLAWTGTHWDLAGGEALAHLIGQRVGDLIKREADYIDLTSSEARAVAAGDAAARELKDLDPDSDDADTRERVETLTAQVAAAKKARTGLSSRKTNRRKWGVSTKNAGRIAAMLKCAAPHLRRHPDAFNADPLKVATLTHTLTFVPVVDDENPEPDSTRPLVDRVTGRVQYRLRAKRGHDRGDMLTAVMPCAYNRKATAPAFGAFLDLFQPELKKRRTIQQYSGMSLTAQPVQRVMYHTGTGGNGKSVFLEVLSRVLGDGLAVGVPAESVSGQVQNNPSAPTPDIARCYAKRHLRIAELPKDAPLKAETIKKLTGGERWPVRTMYKGYFEFKPTAKPHMSGNGEPKFDGSDGGMRRRLIIVEWSVTLAEEKHRDFEDVVVGIAGGASGILNWLIAGALDFLNNGLVISEDVLKTTAAHFAEMDPCQQYIDAHVRPDPGGPGVKGRAMYEGYKAWAEVNGAAKMHETRFGLIMKKKLKRDDSGRVRIYVDVALHDVPEIAAHPQHDHGPAPPDDRPISAGDMEI